MNLFPSDRTQAKKKEHTNHRHSDKVEREGERYGLPGLSSLVEFAICSAREDSHSDKLGTNLGQPWCGHEDGYFEGEYNDKIYIRCFRLSLLDDLHGRHLCTTYW